jgi:glutaredoxin-dependent peroxiredoxin
MAIIVGSKAPDFSLFDTDKKQRNLKEFEGKKLVILFYPGAFTGVCTKELCSFRDSLAEFNSMNAQVIAISVDGPFANKAFKDQNNLSFPLLSDHSRLISKMYGGVHEDFVGITGYTVAKRSAYVLDEQGVVRYLWVSEIPGVEPPYDEIKKWVA